MNLDQLLQPFTGYIELKMYDEAREELDNLPSEFQNHPLVLTGRLELLVELKKWEEATILGESLCREWPDNDDFFIHTAFAFHELRQTRKAKSTLLKAPATLRSKAIFFYNLACYHAQLGEIEEAKHSLVHCFELDKDWRADALRDPDLQPIWSQL